MSRRRPRTRPSVSKLYSSRLLGALCGGVDGSTPLSQAEGQEEPDAESDTRTDGCVQASLVRGRLEHRPVAWGQVMLEVFLGQAGVFLCALVCPSMSARS